MSVGLRSIWLVALPLPVPAVLPRRLGSVVRSGAACPPGRIGVASRWISPVLLPAPEPVSLLRWFIRSPGFGCWPDGLGFTSVAPRSLWLVCARTAGPASAAATADAMINREKFAIVMSPFIWMEVHAILRIHPPATGVPSTPRPRAPAACRSHAAAGNYCAVVQELLASPEVVRRGAPSGLRRPASLLDEQDDRRREMHRPEPA